MTFILASASPARLRTLRAAGLNPEVIVSGVDESNVESTSAAALCATLARLKTAVTDLAGDSGDTGLDGVLAEIGLRVEVELAKFGPPQGAANRAK